MIDLALRGLFYFFLSPFLFYWKSFPLQHIEIRLRKDKMPCQGLFNDMGRLPPGSSLIPQLKTLITSKHHHGKASWSPTQNPAILLFRKNFYFLLHTLHILSPSHLHIDKDCNPAISLKKKWQSNFSSWGSAVMAYDKVIQAWHDLRTLDVSWQPCVMLALLIQASPDRRTQASLGSFQSYTAHAFLCPYPSWSCQYPLLALFADLSLAPAWVWALPCKFTNPQDLPCHKSTSSAAAASGIAPHDTLTPLSSAWPFCPPFCKTVCDWTQAKIILILKGRRDEKQLFVLTHYRILMIICLLLFRSRDYFFLFRPWEWKCFLFLLIIWKTLLKFKVRIELQNLSVQFKSQIFNWTQILQFKQYWDMQQYLCTCTQKHTKFTNFSHTE